MEKKKQKWRVQQTILDKKKKEKRESRYYEKLKKISDQDARDEIREALEERQNAASEAFSYTEKSDEELNADAPESHEKSPPGETDLTEKKKQVKQGLVKKDAEKNRKESFEKSRVKQRDTKEGFQKASQHGGKEGASGFQKSEEAFRRSAETISKEGAKEGAKASGGGNPYVMAAQAAEKTQEEMAKVQKKLVEEKERKTSEHQGKITEIDDDIRHFIIAGAALLILLTFLPIVTAYASVGMTIRTVAEPVINIIQELDEETEAFQLLTWAVNRIGCEYDQTHRDQENPDRFDCSSFTRRAFASIGITLSDTAAAQGKQMDRAGCTVEEDDLELGDLIFYSFEENDRFMSISHVAIYIGNGYIIHCSESMGVAAVPMIDHDIVLCGRPFDLN